MIFFIANCKDKSVKLYKNFKITKSNKISYFFKIEVNEIIEGYKFVIVELQSSFNQM